MIDYYYFTLQNPWWENRKAIEEDEKIKEFEKLRYRYSPHQVLDLPLTPAAIHLITGPRQTGKSTALKLYIKSLLNHNFSSQAILFFDCDALSTIQDIIDVVVEFRRLTRQKKYAIVLDEISSVEKWPQAIKWLADNGFLKDTTLFLTGSSSLQLKKSGEFMPGRRGVGRDVNFLPVTFKEYLNLNEVNLEKKDLRFLVKTDRYLESFLLSGGFLRNINYGVVANTSLYLATFRSEFYKAGKKEEFIREVVRKILTSLSSQTSYTNIAEEAELGSKNTAVDYLSFLADTFFVSEVKFYDISQKRLVLKKNKKYYTTDPYLIWLFNSFVYGSVDFASLEKFYITVSEKAKIIENFIATELFKAGVEFYYFQNSRELDFYLPNHQLAIEVKYKDKITREDIKPLELRAIPKKTKRIIVTRKILKKVGDINLIPAHLVTLSPLFP